MDLAARSSTVWVPGAVKGSQSKTPQFSTALAEFARHYAHENVVKPVVVDIDTTRSTIASLVVSWLVHSARSDDTARITEWLAQRHGRVLTATQRAVLDGILGDPALRLDPVQPGPDDDPAAHLRLLDGVLAGASLPNLAVWPGADGVTSRRVIQLLERWEDTYGPVVTDTASAADSLSRQGNLTLRRVAAILVSWVIEVAGSDDPQRIAGCLPEFDLVLTAAQRATLAELVADATLRMARETTRTVLHPETYLALLSAVLSAPRQER